MLLRLEVLSRYSKGCLFFNHSSAKIQKDYMTSFFLCLLCRESNLQIHGQFLCTRCLLWWKLSSDRDGRDRCGSKEENQTDLLDRFVCSSWLFFFREKEKKGGGGGREGAGACYTCASLTSDKRIFQTDKGFTE